ncbi:hypothetical protein [Winogradskyella sp. SYSU M77433]|uniref:hypothetical protein n=1 Tax=Winogradskyella sp. SYSU M77433 TaxID=3042722 RepID=UPI00248187CF|nr:hypothetical protein [Winogradskyella sp. SYSU M77433]MDH7913212.1 hypothetical protein [Winogradskyella sp. SYSU M77433]
MDDKKFLGIASACDFENVNLSTLDFLVKKGVVKLNKSNDNFLCNLSTTESKNYEFPLFFRGNVYELTDDFIDELYKMLEEFVSSALSDPSIELNKILFETQSFLDSEERISFLKMKFREFHPKSGEFALFEGNLISSTGLNGIMTWYEYIGLNISLSPNLLSLYLKNKPNVFMNLAYEHRNELAYDGLCGFYELLKEWSLFYEANYILNEIKNQLKKLENSIYYDCVSNSSKISALEIAYYAYYQSQSKPKFLNNTFPSEAAYKELSAIYGPHWANIKKSYLEIFRDKDKRLKYSRKAKIKKIIPFLSNDAQDIAIKEFDSIL